MKDTAWQAAVSILLCHSHQQPHWPVTGGLMRHRGSILGSLDASQSSLLYHNQEPPLQSNLFPISQPAPWASWAWWSVRLCIDKLFWHRVTNWKKITKFITTGETSIYYHLHNLLFFTDSVRKKTTSERFESKQTEKKLWIKNDSVSIPLHLRRTEGTE